MGSLGEERSFDTISRAAEQAVSNNGLVSMDEALGELAGSLLSHLQNVAAQSSRSPKLSPQIGSTSKPSELSLGSSFGSLLSKDSLELLSSQSLDRDQLISILKAKMGTNSLAEAPEEDEKKEEEEPILEKSRVILHQNGKKVAFPPLVERLSKLVQKDRPKALSAALLELLGPERKGTWQSHEAFLRQLLHEACRCDAVNVAEMLLDGSEIPAVAIDGLDEKGRTALHHAAECHSLECIELLIRRRAKVDIKDERGYTALESAMQSLR
jgi:hypothetical protein